MICLGIVVAVSMVIYGCNAHSSQFRAYVPVAGTGNFGKYSVRSLLKMSADGNKWGFINYDGELKIEPEYDDARNFHEGYATVKVGELWGVINTQGEFIISPRFASPIVFRQQRAPTRRIGTVDEADITTKSTRSNSEIGFVDLDGNWIFKPLAESAYSFHEGRAGVKINGKWGIIDLDGNWVVEPKFDKFHSYSEGLAVFEMSGGKRGVVDLSGNTVLEFSDDIRVDLDMARFSNGWLRITRLNPWSLLLKRILSGRQQSLSGYVNRQGGYIPLIYDGAGDFSERFATVCRDRKCGLIDEFGKKIIDFKFDSIDVFSEGLAAFKFNGKWGYINTSGDIVVEPKFSSAIRFSEGFGSVKVGEKYASINRDGEIVIDPISRMPIAFRNGVAPIYTNENWCYIDRSGSRIWCSEYSIERGGVGW